MTAAERTRLAWQGSVAASLQPAAPVQRYQPTAPARYYQPAATTRYYQNTVRTQQLQAAQTHVENRRRVTLQQQAEFRRQLREREIADLRQRQKDNQRGVFDRIKQGVANTLSDGKRTAEHLLGTPGRYFGALQDRHEAKVFSEMGKPKAQEDMQRWEGKYLATSDEARRKYAAGEYTYEQAIAAEEAAYNEMVKAGERWDRFFERQRRAQENPITGKFSTAMGWAAKAASNPVSSTVWKYTLGTGDRKIPSLATAPDRFVKWANERTGLGSGQYYSERTPAGGVKAGTGPATISKGMGAWQRTYNTTYGNLSDDLLNDPLSWLGAAKGAQAAGSLVKAPGYVKRAAGVGRHRVTPGQWVGGGIKRNIPQGLKDATAWQKGTPADRALGWLKAAKQPRSSQLRADAAAIRAEQSRRAQGYSEQVGGDRGGYYKTLNDRQLAAFQRLQNSLGKNPDKALKGLSQSERQKVIKFSDSHNKKFGDQYRAEQAAGDKYDFRQGYFPTPDAEAYQARRVFRKPQNVFSRDELEYAAANRQLASRAKTDPRFAASKDYQRYAAGNKRFGGQIKELQDRAGRAYRGPRESIQRGLRFPTTAAKLMWLRFNPSWYVNNTLHSAAVTAASGGLTGLGQAAKFAVRPGQMKQLPQAIAGGQAKGELGRFSGKFAPYAENVFRSGIYSAAKKRGLSDSEATKLVNKEMFDYGKLANWERPLNAVFPFWRWEKNINRYMATMPGRHPTFTKAYQTLQNEQIDSPFSRVPTSEKAADGSTFQAEDKDRPNFIKDKLHIPGLGDSKLGNAIFGGDHAPTGGFPMTRGQRDHVGLNPLIQMAMGLTGRDSFGSDLKGQSPFESLFRMSPQGSLIRRGLQAANFRTHLGGKEITLGGRPKETDEWYTETYNTKEQQGFDPSRPNYDPSLDVVSKFKEQLRSLFGVRAFDFDEDKFREGLRFQGFMRDYIAAPWEREKRQSGEPLDYEEKQARRRALAANWGFDLERDIYKGKFAKNDTQVTYLRKRQEAITRDMQKQLYDAYYSIPKGKRAGTGNRSEKLEEIRQKLADPEFRRKYKNISFWPNTDWVNKQKGGFGTGQKGSSRRGVFRHGKWFKSEATAARYGRYLAYRNGKGGKRLAGNPQAATFWRKFFASDAESRLNMLNANPQYAKNKRGVRLAWLYRNVDPDTRKEIMAREDLSSISTKRSAQEWTAWRATKSEVDRSQLLRDESRIAELAPRRSVAAAAAKAGVDRKPKTYTKPIKVLTFGGEFK